MRILRFFLLWIILTLLFSLFNSSFVTLDILIQAVNSLLYTSGFYFSYHKLIKGYFYQGRTLTFFAIYLLVIACMSSISMVSTYQIYILQGKKFFVANYWNEPVFFTSNLVLMFLVTSSLLSFRILRDKMKTQEALEDLEKEKISAELGFLKAQINPHFLFNSLNNILFQIDKSNKDARETLLKFSEMLRYQLYECSSDYIEIEKELHYIKNYIEIQMLRKTDRYKCTFTVSDSVKNFSLAPLLLTPFIENAFKYISNHSNGKNEISISMDYKEGEFSFHICNDKDQSTVIEIHENKGIGLANVRRRLDLLYPDKHSLEIRNESGQFSVAMKMNIN
ncbi:MAG TPA: histidine kinase [Bacteroidia bacterium]|nr:histidine kinase [Bacteroidia bacterium]